MAELFCPCDQRAVAGDLVVLDCLRVRNDRGIEYGLVLDVACGLSASLIRPSIAGQSVPEGCFPSFLKTWSRRSICLLVSSR